MLVRFIKKRSPRSAGVPVKLGRVGHIGNCTLKESDMLNRSRKSAHEVHSTSFVSLLLAALVGLPLAAQENDEIQGEAQQLVRLELVYGDGFRKVYESIPWRDGLKVSEVMDHAAGHKHATTFNIRGREATAFLQDIDGIQNLGYGDQNWIFYVNGKKAEESFGIVSLQAGDIVSWRYEKFP